MARGCKEPCDRHLPYCNNCKTRWRVCDRDPKQCPPGITAAGVLLGLNDGQVLPPRPRPFLTFPRRPAVPPDLLSLNRELCLGRVQLCVADFFDYEQRDYFFGVMTDRVQAPTQEGPGAWMLPPFVGPLAPLMIPEKCVIDSIFEEYRSSALTTLFPVVDPAIFRNTIVLASALPLPENLAVVIVASFICFMSSLRPQVLALLRPELTPNPVQEVGEIVMLARHVERLLPDFITKSPSVDALQAAVMMALYWDFKGRLLHASRYLQLATDCMAKLLRERRNFQPGHPARLFTLCWFCDAHFALRIGYGTSFPHGLWANVPEHNPGWLAVQPSHVDLTTLKVRVLNTLYFGESERQTVLFERREQVIDCLAQLRHWQRATAVKAPDESDPPKQHDFPTGACLDFGTLAIFTKIEGLFLESVIHYALASWEPIDGLTQKEKGYIFSSSDATINSCREMIAYLCCRSDELRGEPYWSFVFYVAWAGLVMFYSTLSAPDLQTARKDLDILREVPGLLIGMYRNQPFAGPNFNQAQMIHGVQEGLFRLARKYVEMRAQGELLKIGAGGQDGGNVQDGGGPSGLPNTIVAEGVPDAPDAPNLRGGAAQDTDVEDGQEVDTEFDPDASFDGGSDVDPDTSFDFGADVVIGEGGPDINLDLDPNVNLQFNPNVIGEGGQNVHGESETDKESGQAGIGFNG